MVANIFRAIATLGLLFILGCGGSGTPPVSKKSQPPPVQRKPLPRVSEATKLPAKYRDCNLIFVSFDALQAAHVGALGNPRDATPTLDALAQQSFVFTHYYSVSSWTLPASMTWFTGVYPSEHGMTNKFAVYNRDVQQPARLSERSPGLMTLAEILKQNGYATAGFTGNAGVSGAFGYDQGFDTYQHEQNKFGTLDNSAPQAIEWLKQHHREKFFLFLHGYDVHGQSLPQGGFDYRYVEDDYDKKFRGSPQEQELLREEGLERGKLQMRDDDVQFWRAIYDEKIARADAKFKRFLDEVEKLGLLENTLLVVTSDHGTEFYEHQRFDHGFTLYDEQIHVPLIIRLPGQQVPLAIDAQASSIDLMPTVLDLLDVTVPEDAQKKLRGQSLSPALQGNTVARNVFSETDYRQYTYKRSIITPQGDKLIYTLENRSRELFHLATDPGEMHNVAATEPKLADELQRLLFEHYRAIGQDLTARQWEVGLNPVYDSQKMPVPSP